MTFANLCVFFEAISCTNSRPEKLKIWTEYFTRCSEHYQTIRLVIPKLDKSRSSYNIKEATLTNKYIVTLCISKSSNEAKRLHNFKAVKRTRDLPGALESILINRCQGTRVFSIEDINVLLDSVENGTGNHNDKVNHLIETLVRDMIPVQQKWLCRIILKDLHLGMSELSFLTAIDPKAEAAYTMCSDLRKICENLGQLASICQGIVLGQVFKPMLADRVTDIEKIEVLMNNREFIVETKYDGERMQVHKEGEKYLYYSRGAIEYSHVYGENALIGSLTPFIHPHILANNCILDGEIMVFDLQEGVFITKAEGKDARKIVDTSRFVPSFIAYDIVYLDSQNLTLTSLTERRVILERVIRPAHGYLSMSRFASCTTKAAVVDLLNEAIERGEEGLVVKSCESIYTPDKRIDGGWFKIKTDYLGLMNDTVDVVIVGGFYGKHTASGKIRNFLCALKSSDDTWTTFCKVSSGITKHDLENKLSKLEPFWKKFDISSLPGCITMGREKPHVVIDPAHSLVLEIRGAELMNSSHFGLPLTLRFPRVVCVRDKLPEDCTRVSELEAMRTQNKRGVAKVGSHNISPRKKKKIDVKLKIEVKSSGLENKQFCVLSASESVTKEQAETFIKEHSGEVVCTPIPGSIVLCGRQSVSVKNVIKQGQHVVQDVSWVRYCQNKLRPCPPRLILHCPADMRGRVTGGFDEHGDSYTEPVTVDELHQITSAMTTDIPDDVDVGASLKRYPEFADFWRFTLKDIVLWTRQRCAISYTAEIYGAQVTTDADCPLVTHRLEQRVGEEGTGKLISRCDLLELLQPFISQELYRRFNQM